MAAGIYKSGTVTPTGPKPTRAPGIFKKYAEKRVAVRMPHRQVGGRTYGKTGGTMAPPAASVFKSK